MQPWITLPLPWSLHFFFLLGCPKWFHFESVVAGGFGTAPLWDDYMNMLCIVDKAFRSAFLLYAAAADATAGHSYTNLLWHPLLKGWKLSSWRTLFKNNKFIYLALVLLALWIPIFEFHYNLIFLSSYLPMPLSLLFGLYFTEQTRFFDDKRGEEEIKAWYACSA